MSLLSPRENMVEGQIRPNKVVDEQLIQAFLSVPREKYVEAEQQTYAYIDTHLPLQGGRVMLEPMVLARMIQALALEPSDKVLIVGSGYGYAAALCAYSAEKVYALGSVPQFGKAAASRLDPAQAERIQFCQGDLRLGWPEAPYQAILVNGSAEELPEVLFERLAEGGRLTAIVDDQPVVGTVRLFVKERGIVGSRPLFESVAPLLPEFKKPDLFKL